MVRLTISAEELIMLEAFKTIRKLSKDRTVSTDEAADASITIINNVNQALDILGVD